MQLAAEESAKIREAVRPEALAEARSRLLLAGTSHVRVHVRGAKAEAAGDAPHNLLHALKGSRTAVSASAAGLAERGHFIAWLPDRRLPPGPAAAAAVAEALAYASLLLQTAEACEVDAARRCIPLAMQMAELSAASMRRQLAVTAERRAEKRRRLLHLGTAVAEHPAGSPSRATEEGEASSGTMQTTAASSAAASRDEDRQRYAAVLCIARWGQIVAIHAEAAREHAGCVARLQRLRAQAEAAASWIEPRAANAAAVAGAPP